MKQEKIDDIMQKIDKKCKLPKHWDDFIKKHYRKHNIIIKDTKNKEFFCTNCNHIFNNQKFNVGKIEKCPNCKGNFIVSGKNYYLKSFEDYVILLQRVDKQIVARVFEIYSFFNDKNSKTIDRDVIEYARILPGVGTFIGNNVYFYYMRKYDYISWL